MLTDDQGPNLLPRAISWLSPATSIDGQPGHVTQEQIDRRPALDREFFLCRDERHGPDLQGGLIAIIVSDRNRVTLEP
jgi:hypothetical protein